MYRASVGAVLDDGYLATTAQYIDRHWLSRGQSITVQPGLLVDRLVAGIDQGRPSEYIGQTLIAQIVSETD